MVIGELTDPAEQNATNAVQPSDDKEVSICKQVLTDRRRHAGVRCFILAVKTSHASATRLEPRESTSSGPSAVDTEGGVP
jgi:hypothetical protein